MKSTNVELRKEALWCICNAITTGDDIIVGKILQNNNETLSHLNLGTQFSSDRRLLMNVIEALDRVFKLYSMNNHLDYARKHFEDLGGLDNFDRLQKNGNYEVYERATAFLTKYF